MLEELARKLTEARGRALEAERLEGLLARTRLALEDALDRRGDLEKVFEKEGRDVRKLEGLGLRALFHSVLGDKEQQLDKERREFLAARLRLDECGASIAALRDEARDLEERVAALGDARSALESAVREKESALRREGGRPATLLAKLARETALARTRKKEIEEALGAARASRAALDEVAGHLRSARNWGTFDMLGGGIIATAVKRGRIDDANRATHRAQQHLSRLCRELADVEEAVEGDLEVTVSGFLGFADYFFDGLIVDWAVQSKIRRSQEEVERAVGRVDGIQASLERSLIGVTDDLADAEAARREVIEGA